MNPESKEAQRYALQRQAELLPNQHFTRKEKNQNLTNFRRTLACPLEALVGQLDKMATHQLPLGWGFIAHKGGFAISINRI